MKVFFKDREEFEEYHEETVEELMQLEKKELAERVFELDQHTALRHTRPLIKRFDEEFDKEDLEANPDRTYAGTLPDAEEVYRRYYNQKEKIEKIIKITESYNLGKYDYSIPPEGIIEILETLKGSDYNG